tara:strand:+ start:5937 stop:7493 length:1557 start_codon:yes stop_codon:yes gene_type:complete
MELFAFLELCSHMFYSKEEFLLTKNKDKNILQSLIVDVAKQNISKIWNETLNENHFISFWMKDKNNCCTDLHIENEYQNANENDSKYNQEDYITSIIYLNDNNTSPTLLMNVDFEKYKKEIHEFKDFSLSFPKKYNVTTFGKNILHGRFDMFCYDNTKKEYIVNDCLNNDRSMLVIQVSKKKPQFVPIFDKLLLIQRLKNANYNYDTLLQNYNNSEKLQMFYLQENKNIKNITCPSSLFDDTIIHRAVTNGPHLSHLSAFKEYIEPYIEQFSVFKIETVKENEGEAVIKYDENRINNLKSNLDVKIQNMTENITQLNQNAIGGTTNRDLWNKHTPVNDKHLTLSEQKFIQRHVIQNFINDLACNWIIFESERYIKTNNTVWKNNRHIAYPTYDIAIENIPNVFSFCLHGIMPLIKEHIEQCYTIDIQNIDVRDLFIVKYGENEQHSLDLHYDGEESNITASILLNNDFEGAELEYEDGCITHLNTGYLCLHTINHKHKVLPLKNGTRYVLVFFLHISF